MYISSIQAHFDIEWTREIGRIQHDIIFRLLKQAIVTVQWQVLLAYTPGREYFRI